MSFTRMNYPQTGDWLKRESLFRKLSHWYRAMTSRLKSAIYLEGYKIKISFTDGVSGVIDLENKLWGEVFEPLKKLETFRAFKLDSELKTIVWPTGADLAPEFLYQKAAA